MSPLQGLSVQAEGKGVVKVTGATLVAVLNFSQWVGVVISAVVCYAVLLMSALTPFTIAQDILVASNASIWMHDQNASFALFV